MEVALITPTAALNEFASRSKYHLVLADRILSDEAYREYYAYRAKMGDYIMLDNCAYELGQSLSEKQLLACVKGIKPTAMFLPDVRFKTKETLSLVEQALPKFREMCPNLKLLGVPQGSNLEEVLRCYNQLMALGVDGFGIYEEIGEVTGLGRRADFLNYLSSHNRVSFNKTYHCLGMEEDVEQIKLLAEHPWVKGVDSAKPYVYGMFGVSLSQEGPKVPYPHRPKGYFESVPVEEFRSTIHHNITMVQQWVKDPLANIR